MVVSEYPYLYLVERVCQIVELLGLGEALDEERIVDHQELFTARHAKR